MDALARGIKRNAWPGYGAPDKRRLRGQLSRRPAIEPIIDPSPYRNPDHRVQEGGSF